MGKGDNNDSIVILKSELDKRIEDLEKLGDKITEKQQEELTYLYSKKRTEEFIEKTKTKGTFLNSLYATETPKKDAIQGLARDLEVQYVYESKNKMTTTVKSVGSISSYIKSLLRSLGAHDSSFSYVHEVLMFKYKADDPNAKNEDLDEVDAEHRQNSSLNIDYSKENQALIETFCDVPDELTSKRRAIYKNFSILSKMSVEERLLFEENSLNILASKLIELQSYDNRRNIPSLYQQFLFDAFMVQTNNEATSLYWVNVKLFNEKESERRKNLFSKSAKAAMTLLSENDKKLFITTMQNIAVMRKKISSLMKTEKIDTEEMLNQLPELTPKQGMKYINGFVPDLLELMNPKTRNEAITMGYYGIRCPQCGDWKVERTQNDAGESRCLCHKCDTMFDAKSYPKCISCRLPFFDEYLPLMHATATYKDDKRVETNCPKCKREVIFDLKLMEKVVITN